MFAGAYVDLPAPISVLVAYGDGGTCRKLNSSPALDIHAVLSVPRQATVSGLTILRQSPTLRRAISVTTCVALRYGHAAGGDRLINMVLPLCVWFIKPKFLDRDDLMVGENIDLSQFAIETDLSK